MCEFCTEHGEGKKWYLQMKNYSKELEHEEPRRLREILPARQPATNGTMPSGSSSSYPPFEALRRRGRKRRLPLLSNSVKMRS